MLSLLEGYSISSTGSMRLWRRMRRSEHHGIVIRIGFGIWNGPVSSADEKSERYLYNE